MTGDLGGVPAAGEVREVDVLIVGAGLSGIGAAYRLQAHHPQRSYAVLEARASTGGTWDLFRYPGVRSDSDMHTLGYPFRPWPGPESIADGDRILAYLRETATQAGIDAHVRTGVRVTSASWCSSTARWTVRTATGEQWRCAFLFLCSGYYDLDRGYRPALPGLTHFRGPVVHPQHWPADLDVRGTRVVVVGSGATAVSLVPALAGRGAQVTMLQRSPSWMLSMPRTERYPPRWRAALPPRLAAAVVRGRNALGQQLLFAASRRFPARVARWLTAGVARQLPDPAALGLDLAVDFAPRYRPWDQRMCFVPDGDLFAALRAGTASIVTDRISGFTADGVELASGTHLPADVLVTATGLALRPLGGVRLDVDGVEMVAGQRLVHRSCMLSDVPNLAMTVGYVNASWTLRADLTARWVMRLLTRMDAGGYAVALPRPRRPGRVRPLLDLSSGYLVRGAAVMPKRGSRGPWRMRQNLLRDAATVRFGRIGRGLELRPPPPVGPGPPA